MFGAQWINLPFDLAVLSRTCLYQIDRFCLKSWQKEFRKTIQSIRKLQLLFLILKPKFLVLIQKPKFPQLPSSATNSGRHRVGSHALEQYLLMNERLLNLRRMQLFSYAVQAVLLSFPILLFSRIRVAISLSNMIFRCFVYLITLL